MDSRARRLLLAVLLIAGTIAFDQGSKQIARAILPPGRPIAALPGVVLCLTRNRGAFLSMGAALSAAVRFWVLTVGVLAALVAILTWLLVSRAFPASAAAGMALIVGGGLSNLADRLAQKGEVTDFLVLWAGPLHTGVFNLADVAITAGTLLLFTAMRAHGRAERTGPPGDAAA
jgi:signal peptidase II